MSDFVVQGRDHHAQEGPSYSPPTVTYLGDLADLTQAPKTVGGADGSTFLGLDIGS